MLTSRPGGQGHRGAFVVALAVAILGTFAPGIARAHFRLVSPPNWVNQANDGSPQKTGPCGNEPPQTATNMVTTFRPGQTVTFQLNETVFHPGHYRVALANTQGMLPKDPDVTPVGTDPCGSTVIEMNPTPPILADGLLKHSMPLNGQQSVMVTLPNTTCTNCVLQIIEYMSNHGAPCFYHHCAMVNIQGTPVDGGTVDSGSAGAAGAGGRGGAGGASGSGGQGGASGGAGGAGGSGGNTGGGGSPAGGAGGGTGGDGGSTAAGGSTSSSTASSTMASTSGSTSTSGSSGTGGASGTTPPNNDTGCSCSVPGRSAMSWAALGGLAALVLATGRRRHRR
jgi:hypothetical protein